MPVHAYTIKAGTTSKLFVMYARDPGGTGGRTGLAHDAPGATAAYVREGEEASAIPLVQGEVGRWSPGSFVEVDPELMPGVYQFGVPDALLAGGSGRALLVLRFPGADIDPVEIDLVGFDPLDSVRLGLTALSPEARVEALRGAFPRLAAKEIEERMAMKEGD